MARAFETKPARSSPSSATERSDPQTRGVPPAADFTQLANRLHVGAPIQRRAAQGPERDFSGITGPGRPAVPGGLPAGLRADVEARSGLPMDDVRVHRHSDKPARIGALAYAQGRDIHLGPGQERHLAHEAWHVVQQKQGRVRPTRRIGGLAVNDAAELEREADGPPAPDAILEAQNTRLARPGGIVQGKFTVLDRSSGKPSHLTKTSIDRIVMRLGRRGIVRDNTNGQPLDATSVADVRKRFLETAKDPLSYNVVTWLDKLKKELDLKFNIGLMIRNPKARRTRTAKEFSTRSKIALGGANQGGKRPDDAAYKIVRPRKKVKYSGFRSRQTLHQISDVFRLHLEKIGMNPVEVQIGYIDRGGGQDLDMMISANDLASQDFIEQMTAEDIKKMFDEAIALPKGNRARKSAMKVLGHRKRLARKAAAGEDAADLARAAGIAESMTSGRFRTAMNMVAKTDARHAEQNIYDPNTFMNLEFDIAGTKIRCAACCAEIGLDEIMADLHLATGVTKRKNGNKIYVVGKMYMKQAGAEKWDALSKMMIEKTALIDEGNPDRDQSDSDEEDTDL